VKRFIFVLFISLLIFVGFYMLKPVLQPIEPPSIKQKQPFVKINSVKIDVEIADTKEKQELGLMNRTKLCSTCGMLFVFDKEGFYPFWMKNTLISLDIIWINSAGKIVSISKNTKVDNCDYISTPGCQPKVYKPTAFAKYVLEVNASFCNKNSIKVGDIVYGL